MLVWLTLPFYDFYGFRSVAVNSVYRLQFLHLHTLFLHTALYFGMQPATQVDSAFHPFEVDKLSSKL